MNTKKLLIIVCILANQFFNTVNAQAPQSFNYQAVARDASGAVLSNQAVSFRISLLQGSATGTNVYSETHPITTNQFGLVNFAIGGGTIVSGSFANINWAQGPYFAQIELDATGGSTYVIMNTTQLLSVPYAQYAEKSGNPTLQAGSGITIQNDSIINTAQNQQINLSGTGQTNITGTYPNFVVNTPNIQAGNGISVTGQTITNTGDLSNTNEIQTLSLSNDTIFLSSGGFVKLPPPYKYLKAPSVTTIAATNIQATTVTLNGNVNAHNLISDVQFEFGNTTSYGNTSIGNPSKVKGLNNNSVSSNISNLLPATTYHFRAKASNAVDESLGNDLSFTTLNSIPLVSTTPISNLMAETATSGGYVYNSGGLSVTARGICWGILSNPTIANNITTNGIDTGTFITQLINLIPNTIYYIRAYATNSLGTGYGNEISFLTPMPVIDVDGNGYDTVHIGTQIWMRENLRTTKLNDGTPIQNATPDIGITSAVYCWYNNNEAAYKIPYGALYNWYAVGSNMLCPSGWHVASNAEWTTLENYLGGNTIAGGKLKEAGLLHWQSPNVGATNESGFTALPGGYSAVGVFSDIFGHGFWWTSTQTDQLNAWYKYMSTVGANIDSNNSAKNGGKSVRCIKD